MTKEKIFDFGVLILRWYLACFMIKYGWGKLAMTQFGVHNASILELPLKEVDNFYVAWHLYGRSEFFNISTGIMEIIGALLIIFNRTAILGALLILTILGQIFIIDISFTTDIRGYDLVVRILGMILSALLILVYYKERIIAAFNILTDNVSTKFQYKWWIFLILPILGLLMDIILGILMIPIRLLLNGIFQ